MENITSSVKALAAKYLAPYRVRNGEIVPKYCPFCGGGDSKDQDTFAVGLYNGAFNCKRGQCNKSGSFRELCNFFGEEAPEEIAISMTSTKPRKLYARPNAADILPLTEEAIAYFERRHISVDTLNAYKVGCDREGNIVFPFYRDDKLIYVKYREPRRYDKATSKRSKEWQMSNTEPILFGMDMVSFRKPLVITEGEIDTLSLYEAGVTNAVSVPAGCNNMEWIEICWSWLEKFQQIILFGDMDDPGIAMMSNLMARLGEDRCMIPQEYPEAIVNGKDYGRICKDANEILIACGKDTLRALVEQCEPAPVQGILNLASVQFVDPTSIPRIYTRIPALDNAIGGLAEGTLTICSGQRGSGKSTIGGQFCLNAIEQGHSVCAYSGELSSYNFLQWIMLQATESKYIEVAVDPKSGKRFAMVPKEIQQRIRAYLDGKFMLFDNTIVSKKPTQEAILDVFTICARRYGCKLFLVDNLMSALQCSADEQNTAQSDFVKDLKNFATKNKVAVILVCHPRKTKPDAVFSNDDVAGSSNITNLADNVFALEKPNIRVTKNREFGIEPVIACSFDPCNRRIFQTSAGDRTVYSWDHSGIMLPEQPACELAEFAVHHGEPVGEQPF